MTELVGLDRRQFTQIAMIAQGDFQKLLLAGTEERGNIFRQIFKTGLYQTLQGRLKDAVKAQWVEYSELKRSISQYMESIVCAQDTPAAEKMRMLCREKFDGRVGEGLEVLEQLCAEDETAVQAAQAIPGFWTVLPAAAVFYGYYQSAGSLFRSSHPAPQFFFRL